jgi:hypothetical protein
MEKTFYAHVAIWPQSAGPFKEQSESSYIFKFRLALFFDWKEGRTGGGVGASRERGNL